MKGTALSQGTTGTTNPSFRTRLNGPALVQVHGVGAGHNWKLDRSDPESFRKIARVLPEKVQRVWMPIPTNATGEIAPASMFDVEHAVNGITFLGKCEADGCFVPKGEAFCLTSADCPVVVAYDRQQTVLFALHAARDSLIDRRFMEHGIRGRKHPGILHALISEMQRYHVATSDVFLSVICGIRSGFTHPVDHETHGEYNRKLLRLCRLYEGAVDEKTGSIDMYALVRGIAVENLGIPGENVLFDNIDTATDQCEGEFLWASARRDPSQRNLVVVHHRSRS